MTETNTPAPISVRATAAPVVLSESTKLILVAGFAVLAEHFVHSDAVMAAVMAASGAVVTAVYGLWKRVETWGALKKIANLVDDSIAVVGGRKP